MLLRLKHHNAGDWIQSICRFSICNPIRCGAACANLIFDIKLIIARTSLAHMGCRSSSKRMSHVYCLSAYIKVYVHWFACYSIMPNGNLNIIIAVFDCFYSNFESKNENEFKNFEINIFSHLCNWFWPRINVVFANECQCHQPVDIHVWVWV